MLDPSAPPTLLIFMLHRLSLLSLVPLSLLAAGSLGATTAEAQAQTELRLFTPAWRKIGEQTPQNVAKRFTIIMGHLPPAPFHEGNPDAKCLKYILGPYVDKEELGLMEKKSPTALAHDAQGGVVKASDWVNWLVAPDDPAWLAYVGKRTAELMNSDFDGLFVDSMGTAPIAEHYTKTLALNPNTRKPYTKSEWLAAENVMLGAIRRALPPGKLLTLNGLGPGIRYWTEPEAASPRVLLSQVQGAMSERIWRDPPQALDRWPTVEHWLLDVRMVQDVERRGLMGFWWTKCWTTHGTSRNEPNADVLIPQWLRFSLASYLLAAGPHSYFNFDTDRDDKPKSNAAEYFPEYDTPIGYATSEMLPLADTGAYVRRFSNGVVLVNPTDKAIPSVKLLWPELASVKLVSSGENRTVSGEFELRAHTGLLLTIAP